MSCLNGLQRMGTRTWESRQNNREPPEGQEGEGRDDSQHKKFPCLTKARTCSGNIHFRTHAETGEIYRYRIARNLIVIGALYATSYTGGGPKRSLGFKRRRN